MSDIVKIIQTILQFQKSTDRVEIVMNDENKHIGIIKDFDGLNVTLDRNDESVHISVDDIKTIDKYDLYGSLTSFLRKKVEITLSNGGVVEAVVMAVDGGRISIVTADGLESIDCKDIRLIRHAGKAILYVNKNSIGRKTESSNDSPTSEKAESPKESPVSEKAESPKESPVSEKAESPKESPASVKEESSKDSSASDINSEEPYKPNAFEQALIDGNKKAADGFVTHPERLVGLGYSDSEAARIKKVYEKLGWSTEAYKTAVRLNLVQLNKNGLAQKYYEMALSESTKGSPEYSKILYSLHSFIFDEGIEEYIAFWNKYASYLKANNAFCKTYMSALIKATGYKPNAFEKALMEGDRELAGEILSQEGKLNTYGYSESDIERIHKAYKTTNWDVSWYHTASRIYGMQVNKNRLSELYYEAALLTAAKKSEEYPKIINALASIKAREGGREYVSFFKKYQERLKNNNHFCMSYANALVALQDWKQLSKSMPMLKEQLAGNPSYLMKLEADLNYYKSMPVFVLSNIKPLYQRYRESGYIIDDGIDEKTLIEKLPDRSALKALLELYFTNREYAVYFALMEYALFIVKDDKAIMLKLLTMLRTAEDDNDVYKLLPRIPVLWCDRELVKRYCEAKQKRQAGECDETAGSKWLENHLLVSCNYRELNPFEKCIVDCDYEEIKECAESAYLLEEMGYSEDEIADIAAVDLEALADSDTYTMRRILAFQGNKNHLAERYLFEAFYENKLDMCNRLFPLLLEEKRGDLILALFAFDRSLNGQMASLRRYYYCALCYAEPDDNRFFNEIKTVWMDYPEADILDRMLQIVKGRGDELLIKQLELQKSKPRENEFETALIEADRDVIRNYVKNANLLVELGYTPEEIQKINKMFTLNENDTGMKPGQIANRVYLYQKNKNDLAERLYLAAMQEDAPEDVLNDCKALFQIYSGQHNYEMVCRIYTDYLSKEMEQKFNRNYASIYCIALYEMEKFREFLDYWEENRTHWEGFSLIANLLHVCEVLDEHAYDDFIWNSLHDSKYRPDIIVKYVIYAIENKKEVIYEEKFLNLFNRYFADFINNDLWKIGTAAVTVDRDRWKRPLANCLLALSDKEDHLGYLEIWFEAVITYFETEEQIDVLFKVSTLFPVNKVLYADIAIRLYQEAENVQLSESKVSSLRTFIYENLSTEEQKLTWLQIQEAPFRQGIGNIRSLKDYLDMVKALSLPEKFWEVYLSYKKETPPLGDAYNDYFDVIWYYYESERRQLEDDVNREILEELIDLSSGLTFSLAICRKMAEICLLYGKRFEADLYTLAARNLLISEPQTDSGESDSWLWERNVSYTDLLLSTLDYPTIVDWSGMISLWSKYVVLSEDDALDIERLRNTIMTPELWTDEEVNILSKALFCEPANYVYWKVLKTWLNAQGEINVNIMGNILFQLSSQGYKDMKDAFEYAIDNGLKGTAFDLLLKMLGTYMPSLNIVAQKALRSIIKKGWFTDGEMAGKTGEIIAYIGRNINLANSEDYKWNSVCAALDLTRATGEYGIFLDTFYDYLSKDCAKQCGAVIAEMILHNQTDHIQKAFMCLNNSFADVPYKELITDIHEISQDRELSEAERAALQCIASDYGNELGVRNLLQFYCEMCDQDKMDVGLETVKILMRYMPYDPVLYEIAACFLKSGKTLEDRMQYYEYMYTYLENSQADLPVMYAVGQMICGENYLRIKGKEVPSFEKLIDERYPQYRDRAMAYEEFCECIQGETRNTECEEFAEILLSAIFMGDWRAVFEYRPGDEDVEAILADNIRTDHINIADDYHRSVIRSAALFILEQDPQKVSDASDRMSFLWDQLGIVRCSFYSFLKELQKVNEESMDELRKIWALDIEILTVFKEFFGKYILAQDHCEEYAQIFAVFIYARRDIFNKFSIQEFLKEIDRDRAVSISEAYERLYIGPTEPYTSQNKTTITGSDYENNVFSNYLKQNSSDYYDVGRRYVRFKEKYDLMCELHDIHSLKDANDMGLKLYIKRQIFAVRSLYYYYSVLMDSVDESVFGKLKPAEFINAVTIALSNNSYMSEIHNFIAGFGSEERKAAGILIMLEQNNLEEAAAYVLDFPDMEWRDYLCVRVAEAYGKDGKESKLARKCYGISRSSKLRYVIYLLKNCRSAKAIDKLDAAVYLDAAMEENDADNNKEASGIDAKADFAVPEEEQILHEEIKRKSGMALEVTELAADVPGYVSRFLEVETKDKTLTVYQEQWKKLNAESDNGDEVAEEITNLSIKIGIALIKQDSQTLDEDIMNELFMAVQQYSISDTAVISLLHDILQRYILSYDSLDGLAESVYKNREAINHLCYEQAVNGKTRVAQDIRAASDLIGLLNDISDDLASAMGEETIKERLIDYRDNLYNGNRKISRFRRAVASLGKMIQQKIDVLNYVPNLIVSQNGETATENIDGYVWEERWLDGAEKGTVRGIVSNQGSDLAFRVQLNVVINSETRCAYAIERIVPGGKIPFTVPYDRGDVNDGRLSWVATVTYYDKNNQQRHTTCKRTILVEFSSEEWGIGYVGREQFNTQSAAEGEEFCGRTNELLKLNSLYSGNVAADRYPSLLITGLRRAGKSSVIKYFCESLRSRDNLAPIYIDGQSSAGNVARAFIINVNIELYKYYRSSIESDFKTFKDRWNTIANTAEWMEYLPEFFIELSELLSDRKVIFILDEMESVFYGGYFNNAQSEERFFGIIRSLIQNYQQYVSFIFCGSDKLLTSCLEQKRESQLFQALQRITVGRMNINDIRDVFEKYNSMYDIKFGDEAINAIMNYTNGLVWYTKVIAYNVLDKIIDREHIVREEIHAADIDAIVELLISGDLGSELIDLLDNNFGARRKAIIRAMARAAKVQNSSVNVEMIASELAKLNYVDNETGEVLGVISKDEILRNLGILEKMDFVEKDARREKAYRFTTELYRLLMLGERKINKFIEVR